MPPLQLAIFVVLGVLSLRGVRSAYVAFILAAVLYFPISVDFHLNPRSCELDVDGALGLISIRNYVPILLAAGFFLMSYAQFRPGTRSTLVKAGLATLGMAALLELVGSVTGHACRLRDLAPAVAGIGLGAAVAGLWTVAWQAISARRT